MGKNNIELLALAKKHTDEGGARFRRYCGMSGGAWCCAFVTYMFHEGNDSPLFYGGKKVVYCPTAIQWCKANLAQIPIYLALPMDVIFFDWNANNVPDHIGFVRERKSDQEVYTIEGNTSKVNKDGKVVATGVVAEKTRPNKYVLGVYRPAFPAKFDTSKPLEIDGAFGYNSIACLQVALKKLGYYKDKVDGILGKNTVKATQAWAGVAQDGSWGVKTTKAIQKKLKVDVDGAWGVNSTKALQKWINAQNKTPAKAPTKAPVKAPVKKTKAQIINDNAVKFAWKKGTPKSKYRKKGGSPNPAFKTAWKKYFPTKAINTGCHSFVMLVLKASGYPTMPVSKGWDDILKYLRKNFKEIKVDFTQAQLKAGDIRVHKNDTGGHHIWIIVEIDGKLYRAEANQGSSNDRYAHINTSNSGNLKKHKGDWLFRAR